MQRRLVSLIAITGLVLPVLSHAVDAASIARQGNGKGAAPNR
jgi:hypothetical protein